MRDTMLILHFIGLAMGLGTAFAHAFLGFTSSKLSKDEAIKLKSNTKILGRMGSIGLILLLVSGVYLILPFWNALAYMPMLQIKLLLFVVLIGFLAVMNIIERKAIQPDGLYRKIEILGKFALTTTLTIVVLAVLVFH